MNKYLNFSILIILFLMASCGTETPRESTSKKSSISTSTKQVIKKPVFNSDSAYTYVEKQVSFGPRVPNTEAHKKAADYLLTFMSKYGDKAFLQEFQARAFDGSILQGKNIIVQFNPEMNHRILLSAHWDSRPFSDQDTDIKKFNTPIDGANDGASGVGVLMEMARAFSQQKLPIGVDIVLFDLEDYGDPSNQVANSYALGSQYWAQNPHQPNYTAQFGILLDMVGAKDATFPLEYFSLKFASDIMKNVWETAAQNGYGNYFLFETGTPIEDDHVYVNKYLGIPMIDIIHLDPQTKSAFFKHWHTSGDTMDKIDKKTLEAVGETLLHVIYKNK